MRVFEGNVRLQSDLHAFRDPFRLSVDADRDRDVLLEYDLLRGRPSRCPSRPFDRCGDPSRRAVALDEEVDWPVDPV